jgi:hypothetical protein
LWLAVPAQNSNQPSLPVSDSVVTRASTRYRLNSFLRRLFMGTNYRNEWEQDVKVPVFHFSGSGFTVKDLGGGMQTKSLHLADAQGKQWSLRTVDKTVTDAALTPALRNKVGRGLSQDLISAAFPYASPVAGKLASAAGIIAANPQIFYVADDSALGTYRSLFAGSLCSLEERDPGFDSTESAEEFLKNIRASNHYKIQQEVYLRARLLDMLIADWDRHADNWRWGTRDSAGFRFYYAVPRDRDWAFYFSKGWVPWLAQKTGGVSCLIPFTRKLKNVKMQSWKSWAMDEELTNELDAGAWGRIIDSFCTLLSNDAIASAVKALPASVYKSDGEGFVKKLESRRDAMKTEVMKYYRFLARDAVVNGSDAEENFVVSAAGEGFRLTVYRGGTKQKIYERSFSPTETYTVTLNGFGGADVFQIAENVKSKIRIKIIGGDGADQYDLKGNVRTTVYDTKQEATVANAGKARFFWEGSTAGLPDGQ